MAIKTAKRGNFGTIADRSALSGRILSTIRLSCLPYMRPHCILHVRRVPDRGGGSREKYMNSQAASAMHHSVVHLRQLSFIQSYFSSSASYPFFYTRDRTSHLARLQGKISPLASTMFSALTLLLGVVAVANAHGYFGSPPGRQPGDAFKAACGDQVSIEKHNNRASSSYSSTGLEHDVFRHQRQHSRLAAIDCQPSGLQPCRV